jgi:NitT/TauT family transport system substrate-binding protein
LADTRSLPPDEIIDALPDALIAGGDTDQLREIIERYRLSLYPESTAIDVAAAGRVLRAQEIAELISPGAIELSALLDTSTAGA